MTVKLIHKGVAEFAGTAILVFCGVGADVFGIDKVGPVGVALTFGLVLLALVYCIGPVSGCHVNPAVTLAVLLGRRISARDAALYWSAQVAGAVSAAAVLKLLVADSGPAGDETGALGSNDWGISISATGAFVLEVVLTALLVVVVVQVSADTQAPGLAGVGVGLTLTVIHLIGIPLDGTSVNPARSLGPALLNGGTPLAHVWLFVLAPLVGAAAGALIAPRLTAPQPAPAPAA
jgi:aquaporin Z